MRSHEKSAGHPRRRPGLASPSQCAVSAAPQTALSIFSDALELLPATLRLRAFERLVERGRIAPDCTSWGTVGFELVCDSLYVRDPRPSSLRRFWNLLYSYSIFFDDLIDHAGPHSAIELMTCDLVLDAVHSELHRLADAGGQLVASFHRHRAESIASMTAETQASNLISALSEESVDVVLGRKAAMGKFFADVVSYYHAGRVCSPHEMARFDSICAAVQILDDLTDVEVDTLSGRTNSISVFIRRAFPGVATLPGERKGDGVRAALIASGRYEAMLLRAEKHLQAFYESYRDYEGGTGSLVRSTLADIRRTRRLIASYRADHSEQCRIVREALGKQRKSQERDAEAMDSIVGLSMIVRGGVRAAN